ncbi:hypothetical protein HZC34_03390 [Candidatus Saganbacteria bacterium]|nr:hypothetical protein [Candidatus Saganbacteria bacterium]
MKKKKIFGLLLAGVSILLFASAALAAGGSHPVKGYILPLNTNYTPATYKMWLSTDATKTSSGNCSYNNAITRTQYQDNIGNWYGSWSNGQVLLSLIEKADAAEAGAGLYGKSSLTLSDATPSQNFADIASLAAIPKPTAAANAGTGTVDLSGLPAPAGTITGYNIYRSTDGTTYTKIGSTNSTTFSDTTGIVAANYTYAVKIVFTGGVETTNRSQKSNQVTYPAKPVAPVLTLNKSSVAFNFQIGGSAPASQTIGISNTGTGTLNWTAAKTAAWLTINPTSGSQTSSMTVSVNTTGLTAGTYNDTISFTSNGGSGSVAVSLTVSSLPVPTIAIAPSTVNAAWKHSDMTITGSNTNFTSSSTVVFDSTDITMTLGTLKIDVAKQIITFGIDYPTTLSGDKIVTVKTAGQPDVSTTLKVTAAAPVISLLSATPSSGTQGQTLASVAIVGSNTNFTNASVVDFGAGITGGTVSVTDATHITVPNVAISATATEGLRTVKVTTGTEVAAGDVFTVIKYAAPPATNEVVIDDIEGTLASGYYQFGPTETSKPITTVITTDKYEGTKSIQTTYPSVTDGWRGWGATLSSTKDVLSMDDISFRMKGDGSSNKVKLQVKDADGTNFAMSDTDAFALTGNTWAEYKLQNFRSKMARVVGSTTGDAAIDWSKITEYQFVFTGPSQTNTGGILIDYVVAKKASTAAADPTIIQVSPAEAVPGAKITVAGTSFGLSGSVGFNDGFTDVYTIKSSGTGEVTTQWIDTSVTFTLPKALLPGKKNVKIVRDDGKTSNQIVFTVLAPTVTSSSYNYPNPFNALAGGTTKIVFATNGATSATAYIFDTIARAAAKLSWTGTGANGEISWDGKNSLSEIVGDGAYLYRVVDAGNKTLGKGKILVVNK